MSIFPKSIVSKSKKSIFALVCVLIAPFGALADVPAAVQAVFENNGCTAAGCHGMTASGGLLLSDAAISEAQLVDVDASCDNARKRVLRGDPDNSVLYEKISNANPDCGASQMPPNGNLMSAADLNTIYDWIVELGDDAQTSGRFEMQNTTASAQETDANIILTVVRDFGTAGPVSIDYTVSTVGTDTATAGEDYVADAGTLSFADGETSKTITVVLVDDDVYEGAEVFSVTLSNPLGGAVLSTQNQTKVTILDNEISTEPGTFFFSRVSYSVAENASTYDVTILRSFGGAGQVTVDLDTVGGTATEASDYQTFSQTLTFAEGEQSQTVTLSVLDDQEVEGNESYSLRLSNPTNGAVLGNPATVNVTITDDESDDSGDDGGDDGGDGGDDGGTGGDDSGTQFEVPEQEDYSAAGSIGSLVILISLMGGLFVRSRNKWNRY